MRHRPATPSISDHLGRRSPRRTGFLPCWQGPRADLRRGRGRKDSPRAAEGVQHRPRSGGEKWASTRVSEASGAGFRVGWGQTGSPRAGLVTPTSKEDLGPLQDVISFSWCLRCLESFTFFAFQPLSCSFCSHTDTGVLILTPLKRVALSARGPPSEPRS
jgi:hypothetical protein